MGGVSESGEGDVLPQYILRLHEGGPEPMASRHIDMASDPEAVERARAVLDGLAAMAPERPLSVAVGRGDGGPKTQWLGVWRWDGGPRWTPDAGT